MKTYYALILTLFTINTFAQTTVTGQKNIIGAIYRNPNQIIRFHDYKEMEGISILPTETGYALSKVSNGKDTFILFEKVIGNGTKQVNYRLLDTLSLGKVDADKIIIMTNCLINKKADSEIVAIVKSANKEKYTSVLKAWRANRKTNKFEKISVQGISCVDEGFAEED